MTVFQFAVLAVLATLALLVAFEPAYADFRGPYCFAPNVPPRVHNTIEPSPKWEWDNRRQS